MVIILDEIRWLISEFFNKIPKPLKFLLFLLFIVGLVSLVPFFTHLIGFHCNSGKEVIKTSPLTVVTNLRLAKLGADDVYNSSSFTPDSLLAGGLVAIENCVRRICIHDDEFFFATTVECENESTITPYALGTGVQDWARCSDCELGFFNSTFIEGSRGVSETKNLCFGDAFARNKTELNWLQRLTCDPYATCRPPENYYYEYDTGTYDCMVPDICGANKSIIIFEVDEVLDNVDGELMYENPESRDFNNVVMLKCDKELRPNITLYGKVPIFDYRIWLLLAVLSSLFLFLNKIKVH